MNNLYAKINDKFYRLLSPDEQAASEKIALSSLRCRRLRKKQENEILIKKGVYKISDKAE